MTWHLIPAIFTRSRSGVRSPSNNSSTSNPVYAESDAGSVGLLNLSARDDSVHMEAGGSGKSTDPIRLQSMTKKIVQIVYYLIAILFGILIGILCYRLIYSPIEPSIHNNATAFEPDPILNATVPPLPQIPIEEVTTEIPSTTPSLTSTSTATVIEFPPETKDAYRNFTEKYNRTFSEIGLHNYDENAKFVSQGAIIFGETQFADLSEQQLRRLLTPVRDAKRSDTSKRCDILSYYNDEENEDAIRGTTLYDRLDKIPSRVDLRRRGIIGDVRNQGANCNAGYAFAVTSLLESKVDTNGTSLSVQMLLAHDLNHHCEGGETFRAMSPAADTDGIVAEGELPFDETQQWHEVDENATRFKYEQPCVLTGSKTERKQYWDKTHREYRYMTPQTVPASTYIKQFLAKIGTVVVEVPVNRAFFFYKSGPYAPDCNETAILGYQPAVVVGYGKRNGDRIWILRNSFGTEWGIAGDFEMKEDSTCGSFDYAFSFYRRV